jgi:hypothetical protein
MGDKLIQVAFAVDRGRYEALKEVAGRQFCSVAAVVRQAVDAKLNAEGVQIGPSGVKGEPGK